METRSTIPSTHPSRPPDITLVPGKVWSGLAFDTARRRFAYLCVIAIITVAAHLSLAWLLPLQLGRLTLETGLLSAALSITGYWVCTRANVSDRTAVDICLTFLVVATWATAVGYHFDHARRVDLFTNSLITLLLLPMFSAIGLLRCVLAALAMGLAQPVTAYAALEAGVATGSIQDVALSALTSMIVAVLTLSICAIMQGERRAGALDIGGYHLVHPLGSGGMGEVWEGTHAMLASPAAIKLLRPSEGRITPESVERFTREARTTASLTSEHTIRLFDFGRTNDDRFYYAMEYLEGLDLQRTVEMHGPLTADQTIDVMLQVCDSLEEAHEAGFIHRDLKPSNLFLTRRGTHAGFVKVLDFGLVTTSSGRSALTERSRFIGTTSYATPEALKAEPLEPSSDIYQLGCIMFFLLTGRRVFPRSTPMAIAVAHVQEKPPNVAELSPHDVPADLTALIERCLDKDPKRRPQDASDFHHELEQLAGFERWSRDDGARFFDELMVTAHDHEEAPGGRPPVALPSSRATPSAGSRRPSPPGGPPLSRADDDVG